MLNQESQEDDVQLFRAGKLTLSARSCSIAGRAFDLELHAGMRRNDIEL